MILRDRCSTSYDLASFFRGRRSTLDRKSRRIALFLMLSNSKIEEVSQNCFLLDVVKFKKMKKSRRIAAFLMLSSSKNEEVSQNSSVFKLADRQVHR